MKRLAPFLALLTLLGAASSALAQNAGQIDRARAGQNCGGCNLFQADLANLTLKGKSFAKARLRQADLSLSILKGSRFTGADMRDVEAYGAVFTGADLSQTDLTHASLVGAYLNGANLAGARLDGTNLSGAEMDRALGLTQAQLNRACGDAATTLPRSLHIPACR
jgi:uncharacterized protein YjbI with pentapeptide repeats